MVRSHAEVENAGGLDRTRFSVGYLDANHQGEGDLLWRPLSSQVFKVEHSRGHAYAPPYWILRNEVTGELAFMALAWSGNYSVEFSNHENVTNGKYDLMKYEYPCLSFRAGPYGRAPMRTIAPGETVATPELHVGLFHATLDTAVASWYDHVRRSVIPERPAGKGPFVAAGRVVEEPGKWILDEIDIAAEMGVEGFMVDAGWYGSQFATWWELRGDWHEGDWLARRTRRNSEARQRQGSLLWIVARSRGDHEEERTSEGASGVDGHNSGRKPSGESESRGSRRGQVPRRDSQPVGERLRARLL